MGFWQNPRFPDAAGAGGRTLKSRSRPFPTHPGMKYFCKGDPRCWQTVPNSSLEVALQRLIQQVGHNSSLGLLFIYIAAFVSCYGTSRSAWFFSLPKRGDGNGLVDTVPEHVFLKPVGGQKDKVWEIHTAPFQMHAKQHAGVGAAGMSFWSWRRCSCHHIVSKVHPRIHHNAKYIWISFGIIQCYPTYCPMPFQYVFSMFGWFEDCYNGHEASR